MREKEVIKIPSITLEWDDWYHWDDIKKDVKNGGIEIPKTQGVYEVSKNKKETLTIGKASDLRKRIRRGLVKGKIPHSAGEKIRQRENVSEIFIRWAVTNRPAAVEEELHRRYMEKFGKFPKYVKHT